MASVLAVGEAATKITTVRYHREHCRHTSCLFRRQIQQRKEMQQVSRRQVTIQSCTRRHILRRRRNPSCGVQFTFQLLLLLHNLSHVVFALSSPPPPSPAVISSTFGITSTSLPPAKPSDAAAFHHLSGSTSSVEDIIAALSADYHEKTTFELLLGDFNAEEEEGNMFSQESEAYQQHQPVPQQLTLSPATVSSGNSSKDVILDSLVTSLEEGIVQSTPKRERKSKKKKSKKSKKKKKKKDIDSALQVLMNAAKQQLPHIIIPLLSNKLPVSPQAPPPTMNTVVQVRKDTSEAVNVDAKEKPVDKILNRKEETLMPPPAAKAKRTRVSKRAPAKRKSASLSSNASMSNTAADKSPQQNTSSQTPLVERMILSEPEPLLLYSSDDDDSDKSTKFIAPAPFVIESFASLYKQFEGNKVKALVQRNQPLPSFHTLKKRRLPRSIFLEVDGTINGVKRYKIEGDPDEEIENRLLPLEKRAIYNMHGEMGQQPPLQQKFPNAGNNLVQNQQQPVGTPSNVLQSPTNNMLTSVPTSDRRMVPFQQSGDGVSTSSNSQQKFVTPMLSHPPQSQYSEPLLYNKLESTPQWQSNDNYATSNQFNPEQRQGLPPPLQKQPYSTTPINANGNASGSRVLKSNLEMPGAVGTTSYSSDESVFKRPLPVRVDRRKAGRRNRAPTPTVIASSAQQQPQLLLATNENQKEMQQLVQPQQNSLNVQKSHQQPNHYQGDIRNVPQQIQSQGFTQQQLPPQRTLQQIQSPGPSYQQLPPPQRTLQQIQSPGPSYQQLPPQGTLQQIQSPGPSYQQLPPQSPLQQIPSQGASHQQLPSQSTLYQLLSQGTQRQQSSPLSTHQKLSPQRPLQQSPSLGAPQQQLSPQRAYQQTQSQGLPQQQLSPQRAYQQSPSLGAPQQQLSPQRAYQQTQSQGLQQQQWPPQRNIQQLVAHTTSPQQFPSQRAYQQLQSQQQQLPYQQPNVQQIPPMGFPRQLTPLGNPSQFTPPDTSRQLIPPASPQQSTLPGTPVHFPVQKTSQQEPQATVQQNVPQLSWKHKLPKTQPSQQQWSPYIDQKQLQHPLPPYPPQPKSPLNRESSVRTPFPQQQQQQSLYHQQQQQSQYSPQQNVVPPVSFPYAPPAPSQHFNYPPYPTADHAPFNNANQMPVSSQSSFPPQPSDSANSPYSTPPLDYPRSGTPMPPLGYPRSGTPMPPLGYPRSGTPMPPLGYPRSGTPMPMTYNPNTQGYGGGQTYNQPYLRTPSSASPDTQSGQLQHQHSMHDSFYPNPTVKGYGTGNMGGTGGIQGISAANPQRYPKVDTPIPNQSNMYNMAQQRYGVTGQPGYPVTTQQQTFNYQQSGQKPFQQQQQSPPFQRQQSVESPAQYARQHENPRQLDRNNQQSYGTLPGSSNQIQAQAQQYPPLDQWRSQQQAAMATVDQRQQNAPFIPQRTQSQQGFAYPPANSEGGSVTVQTSQYPQPSLQGHSVAAIIPHQKLLGNEGGRRGQTPVPNMFREEQQFKQTGLGKDSIQNFPSTRSGSQPTRAESIENIYMMYNLEKSKGFTPPATNTITPTKPIGDYAGRPKSAQGSDRMFEGRDRSEFTLPIIDSPQAKSQLQQHSLSREGEQKQKMAGTSSKQHVATPSGNFSVEPKSQARQQQQSQQSKSGSYSEEPRPQTGQQQQKTFSDGGTLQNFGHQQGQSQPHYQQQQLVKLDKPEGNKGQGDSRNTGQPELRGQTNQTPQQYGSVVGYHIPSSVGGQQRGYQFSGGNVIIGPGHNEKTSAFSQPVLGNIGNEGLEPSQQQSVFGKQGGKNSSPREYSTGQSEHIPKIVDKWNDAVIKYRHDPVSGSAGNDIKNGEGEITHPTSQPDTSQVKTTTQQYAKQEGSQGVNKHIQKHLPHHRGAMPFYSQSEIDAHYQRTSHHSQTAKDSEFENESTILSWYLNRAKKKLRDRSKSPPHRIHGEETSTGHKGNELGSNETTKAVHSSSMQQSSQNPAQFNVNNPHNPVNVRPMTPQHSSAQDSISPSYVSNREQATILHPSRTVQEPSNTTTHGSHPSSGFQSSSGYQNDLSPFSRAASLSPSPSSSYTSIHPVAVQGHGSHTGIGTGSITDQQYYGGHSPSQSNRNKISEQYDSDKSSRSKRGVRNPYERYFPKIT